jgi:glycosidase
MDYRAINLQLGRIEDFESVAKVLRKTGMSLCVDQVLNHTVKEHTCAVRVHAGDRKYQAHLRHIRHRVRDAEVRENPGGRVSKSAPGIALIASFGVLPLRCMGDVIGLTSG